MTTYEWSLVLMCIPFPFVAGYLVGILRERWAWQRKGHALDQWIKQHAE